MSIEKLFDDGMNNPIDIQSIPEKGIYCLCYTSGTTGTPKGALISNKNIISILGALEERILFFNDDIYISYLPLAHVMEIAVMLTFLFNKGKIGFYHGDMLNLKEDLMILRPTIFLSVPRVLNRIYDGIKK